MRPRRNERLFDVMRKSLTPKAMVDLCLESVSTLLDKGVQSYTKLKSEVMKTSENLNLSGSLKNIDEILKRIHSLEETDNHIELKLHEIRQIFQKISPSIQELRDFENMIAKLTLQKTLHKEIIDILLDIRSKISHHQKRKDEA